MSSLVTAAPPPETELPTIYRSGDLVLQNPQETCIIFVSVILVSALLEFSLQRVSNIDNKYARTLVNTMSQEVTIIGVLALFLMFTVSVIPQRFITPLYVSLFSWANMSLFFMATFFVITVIAQFLWAMVDVRLWKTFEEGKLDNEEVASLGYRERVFRQCYDLYRLRLEQKASLAPTALPFYEYNATTLRRQLVRVGNLSYRTWLSLSVVVLANLLRTRLTPFTKIDDDFHRFMNALMYVLVVGWGAFAVFAGFVAVQQWRLTRYAAGTLKPVDGDASTLLPLGTPKRALEFLQIMIMTFNWYLTLFITGNAKYMAEIREKWQVALAYILFALPLLAFWAALPWAFYSVAMLTTIGRMRPGEATRLSRIYRGEAGDSGNDSGSDDDDDEVPVRRRQTSDRGSRQSGGLAAGLVRARSQSMASGSSRVSGGPLVRPPWLEEDDEWDGVRTYVPGTRRIQEVEMDRAFYMNVNTDRVRRMLERHDDPSVARSARRAGDGRDAVVQDADDGDTRPDGRPIWWMPGDDEAVSAAGASSAARTGQADAGARPRQQ